MSGTPYNIMMNTYDLELLVQKNECLNSFAAHQNVFALDEIDKASKTLPRFLIINTQPASQQGLHWVAVFIDRQGKVDFFDSVGEKPPLPIADYMKKQSKQITRSTRRAQPMDSNYCGLYCVYFIAHRCFGYKYQSIMDFFSKDNLQANDKLVRKFALLTTSSTI